MYILVDWGGGKGALEEGSRVLSKECVLIFTSIIQV